MQEAAVRRPLNSKLKASSTRMKTWNGCSDFATTQYAGRCCFWRLCCFCRFLARRDLWAPVEPRYAEIVRIMFAKGEWVVPTVNGDLYTDKPILYFWLALIASKLAGGVNEWTVRLPSALAGIGFVLATYFTGRDFFSPKVGLIAGAVLATSMRVIWEARWAHIDMLFGFFFLLTIYFGARSLLGKGEKREILWAYVFMGLAVLAKGLIGIVLPALLLAAFAIVRRDWRIIIDAKLQLGIPIFLLIAAPWFYLVNSATDGKWLADFIYIHHLQRYTDGMGHRQPFYYYLTTLPADFMPWTVFAIPAIAAYFPYRGLTQRPIPLFFSLCFLVVFLFFSISDTKRDLYLLPLMPTLALLVGNYIDDLTESRLFDERALSLVEPILFRRCGYHRFSGAANRLGRSQGNFLDQPAPRSGYDYRRNGYGYFHSKTPAVEGCHDGGIAHGLAHGIRFDLDLAIREPIQVAPAVFSRDQQNRPAGRASVHLCRYHE